MPLSFWKLATTTASSGVFYTNNTQSFIVILQMNMSGAGATIQLRGLGGSTGYTANMTNLSNPTTIRMIIPPGFSLAAGAAQTFNAFGVSGTLEEVSGYL